MEYKLKHRQRLYIIPLSDLHIGSKHSNTCFIKYALREIRKIKSPKIIYLLGDIIEVATKRVADSVYEQDMRIDEQIDTVKKLFKPLRDDIRFICRGNHEKRLLKGDFNMDVCADIARELNCRSGPRLLDRIKINDKDFTIFLYHGKSRSSRPDLAIGKLKRETANIDADLILYGHLHYLFHWREPIETVDGLRRRYYICTGHFMRYHGSYAEDELMFYQPEGFYILGLNKDCIVDPNAYYIDERAPHCYNN